MDKKKIKLATRKLALKREIVKQLNRADLGLIRGGTYEDRDMGDPRDCLNPIYSA